MILPPLLAETSLIDGLKIIAFMVFGGFFIARKVASMFNTTQKNESEYDDWQPWVDHEQQSIPPVHPVTPPPLIRARNEQNPPPIQSTTSSNSAYFKARPSGPFTPTPPVQGRRKRNTKIDLKYLSSSASLRQAVVTHEILSPPLSLRK